MPEYLTKKNICGKFGISSDAILSIAHITALDDGRIDVNLEHTKCNFYGNQLKIQLCINIKKEYITKVSSIELTQKIKDDIVFAIKSQVGLKNIDVRVFIEF